MHFTETIYRSLLNKSRFDLIIKAYIKGSGYAGFIMPSGDLADTRVFKDAIPLEENEGFHVAKIKEVLDINREPDWTLAAIGETLNNADKERYKTANALLESVIFLARFHVEYVVKMEQIMQFIIRYHKQRVK